MRTKLIPSLVAAGLLVLACGDDDVDSSSAGDTTPSSVVDGSVTVTAIDYAFEGLPASVPAGTQIDLVSGSDIELHEFVAFRLPESETRSAAELAALAPEELFPAIGDEPATVILAPSEGPSFPVIGDGSLDEAGRYLILCIIPTGADQAEYLEKAATSDGPPDVDGGPPHSVNGMYAELVVE